MHFSTGIHRLVPVICTLVILTLLLAPSMLPEGFIQQARRSSANSNYTSSQTSPIIQIPLKTGSEPLGITMGPNGNVWFAENNSTAIIEYNPTNESFRTFSVPTNQTSMIWFMVFDSHGNLWFSNQLQDYLWRFSPETGQFANFTTGNQFVRPFGLVYDNLTNKIWFTSTYTDQIGYFNLSGGTAAMGSLINVTGTPILKTPPLYGPTGIQIGPEGNIFVSEPFSGNIAEYSPTQQRFLQVWNLPTGAQPVGIAIDNEQQTIWFANHASSLFGYINMTTGKVTEFATSPFEFFGDTISLPYWAMINPNGVVWIDEHASNKIARYDPATGMLTEFAVPANRSAPLHLVIDNQRQIVWFTEFFGSNLGKIYENSTCDCTLQLSTRNLVMTSNSVTFYLKYLSNANHDLTSASPDPLVTGTFQINGYLTNNLTSSFSVINSTDFKITLSRGADLHQGNYTITVCPRSANSDNITSPGPVRQCATALFTVENRSVNYISTFLAASIIVIGIAASVLATIFIGRRRKR